MPDSPVRPVLAIDDPRTLAKAGRMIRIALARRAAAPPAGREPGAKQAPPTPPG